MSNGQGKLPDLNALMRQAQKLQGDVQRITDYYASQGRGEATVESIVTPLGDNRANVTFQINEGGRTILYPQEDPQVRKQFAERLAKVGIAVDMPESLYRER